MIGRMRSNRSLEDDLPLNHPEDARDKIGTREFSTAKSGGFVEELALRMTRYRENLSSSLTPNLL